MKKYFLIVIVALIVVIVMSNMTYEQQSLIPLLSTLLVNKPFEQLLMPLEIPYWGRIISIENSGYVYFVEFLIRKATHFFGYGFVGVIFYGIYRHLHWRFPAMLAILTIFVIGSIDELWQASVPGRTGIFKDVLIDTAGATFCITLFALMLFVMRGTTKVRR